MAADRSDTSGPHQPEREANLKRIILFHNFNT